MENKSLRVVNRGEYNEIHLQIVPLPDDTPQQLSTEISDIIKRNKAQIVRATFFGRFSERAAILSELEQRLSAIDFPVTWIEGDNCIDSLINGVYIFAVSGLAVERITHNRIVTGTYFRTSDAEFCYLGGIYSDPQLSDSEQTLSVLNLANQTLNQVNMGYENTIRTWFYLDEILDWYNEFNKARTLFFREHDIFNKLVPASTGISGKNERGSRIGFELNAIKPLSEHFTIHRVKSPKQCSAEDYGSSFSRAVMFSDHNYSYLTISGTASINEKGETVFREDIKKQIELSFEVAMAIMDSQDFKPEDIVRAYAYCSDKKYHSAFIEFEQTKLPFNFAFICAENKICRSDLLFEIEMDFLKKNT